MINLDEWDMRMRDRGEVEVEEATNEHLYEVSFCFTFESVFLASNSTKSPFSFARGFRSLVSNHSLRVSLR